MRFSKKIYKKLSNCIRVLTIDAVEKASSGHPGMPLGMADVATILFADFLKFNPKDPDWIGRDRLILSAGHGSMLLYSLLYLTGYKDITLDDIKNFRQLHSKSAGHPEHGLISGIEATTGPLGQGIANAVGIAISQKICAEKVHKDLFNSKIYVIAGDGCMMEGISHEAASLAGHLQLNNLVVLYDSNDITIDGKRSLADSEDTLSRFKAYGWNTQKANGHNYKEAHNAIANTLNSDKPSIIEFKTLIGYGSPNKEDSEQSHGAPLGKEEAKLTKASYGWNELTENFFIPKDLLKIWSDDIGEAHIESYNSFCQIVDTLESKKKSFLKNIGGFSLPDGFSSSINKLKQEFYENYQPEATRKSSGKIIEHLNKNFDFLVGGSSDLSQSNNSKATSMKAISTGSFDANYIHYGIRENAMSAIMNGISLHGAFIPYGGTFLVFSDYARPSIRMSALMERQVLYILTHDSIGVGEDGPTHQPIEHISSMRAMPNLNVFRPADNIETLECWEIALTQKSTPSALCLTRQSVDNTRISTLCSEENLCSKGAYIISESNAILPLKATIFATGSEVAISIRAQKTLQKEGIGVRVVSVPCQELFELQNVEYQDTLLNNHSIKVAVEAAARFGWDRYIGRDGVFIGMNSFGASGKSADLFNHFCITETAIVNSIREKIKLEKT